MRSFGRSVSPECEACGSSSIGKSGRPKRFCSDTCRCWARLHPGEKRPTGRTCARCSTSIDHLKTHARYCSELCGEIARGERLPQPHPDKTCEVCGDVFTPHVAYQRACCPKHGEVLSSRDKRQRMKREAPEVLARQRREYRKRALARRGDEIRRDKRAAEARRLARKRDATIVEFTNDQLDQRLSMFGYRCWMCGEEADQVDHVKPLARGGAHALCNLRPACGPCNARKWASWPLVA